MHRTLLALALLVPVPSLNGPTPAFTQDTPPPRADLGRTRPKLKDATAEELRALAVQTKRAIEARILTPDPELVDREEALLNLHDTGVCRLQHRVIGGTGWEERILRRGGGAYYSFETRDHSYNLEPDVGYQNGTFCSGFYGYTLGLFLELGEVDLVDLTSDSVQAPDWLPGAKHADWDTLWGPITYDDAVHGSEFKQAHAELQRAVPAKVGTTYLLRRYGHDEHDLLAAFTVLDATDFDVTLAWRILQRWETPSTSRRSQRELHLDVPQGPMWLDGRSLDELVEFLDEVQARGAEVLLEVPAEEQALYQEALGKQRKRFAERRGFRRILDRKTNFRPLLTVRGFGTELTFADLEEVPEAELELRLSRGRFECLRDAGGAILDLGEVPFEDLASVMGGKAPEGLSTRELEAREFLTNVRAEVDETLDRPRRALTAEETALMEELGLASGRVNARVGHTYLFRAFLADTHDHLVVFTVIGKDAHGLSLAYHVLETWPVEAR